MSKVQSKKLLVMAGGTGGHVFPGLAVAKQLQQQGWQIRWLGTADRMEAELVPRHGIEIDFINIQGLKGQGIKRWLSAPLRIFSAVIQARKHIKAYQPDVVLGMGGYVSGPGGVAAKLCGIPLVLHEQNAVAGMTNRWLSKIADKVFQAFPGAFSHAEVVGNPVREDVAKIDVPQKRMSDDSCIRLLIMGGSQGARILNQTLPQVAAQLGEEYQLIHQVGANNFDSVKQDYSALGLDKVQVREFIDDMAQAYAWADLIVCRSGALTVSEIAATGVAAIFVPYQHKDRQQALNADYLVEHQAAMMIEQPQLSVESLTESIRQLDKEQLIDMAIKARQLAKTDAAQVVANTIELLSNKN